MSNIKTFNSNKKSSRKSAFTLIELSIVLIIIGLLVAGITGGASLIRSAQLRSVMSEARGYSVAVNAFRVQYDYLPGDYGTAISPSPNYHFGNQNGKINFIDSQSSLIRSLEGVIALHQLINSGTIDDTLSLTSPTIPVTFSAIGNTSAAPLAIGTNIPDSKLDGVGWVFDNSTGGNVIIATGPVAPIDVSAINTAYHMVAKGAIRPSDAFSIDTKLDDGVANTGRVRGSSLLPAANSVQANCFSEGIYATARTTPDCALEFTVDIS